jgi:putative NADPH-quinone reductase
MVRILVLQGHPGQQAPNLCSMLADAYVRGAEMGGHVCRRTKIDLQPLPPLPKKGHDGDPRASMAEVQASMLWSQHLFLTFPSLLGDMPGVLKQLFDYLLRPGSPLLEEAGGKHSARSLVTIAGRTPLFARWDPLGRRGRTDRAALKAAGFSPVRRLLVGEENVRSIDERLRWSERIQRLGEVAS